MWKKLIKFLKYNYKWLICFGCLIIVLLIAEDVFTKEIMRCDTLGYQIISKYLIYDAITGEVIDAVVKQTFEDCVYRFKYYFCDGKTKTSSIATSKLEELYNDFDGLMDWDEYYDLGKKNLSTHDVLKLASEVYKGFIPKFYKIEIINDKTKEVIDYIEINETK